MRIQHLIYRIELPFATDEEKAQVEELKDVLGRILLYEKTACPFRRGFTVDLPEEQDSPPRRRTMGALPKTRKWEMRDIWRREGENFHPTASEMNSPVEEDEEEDETLETDDQVDVLVEETTVEGVRKEPEQDPFRKDDTKPPIRPRASTALSITAPAQPTVHNSVQLDIALQRDPSYLSSAYNQPIPSFAAPGLDTSIRSEFDRDQLATSFELPPDNVSSSELPPSSLDIPQPTLPTSTGLDNTQEAELSIPSADRSRASSIRSYYTSLELQPGSLPSPVSEYGDPFDRSPAHIHTTSRTPPPVLADDLEDSELTAISSTSQDTIDSDTTLSPPPQHGSESTKTASAIYDDNRTTTLEYDSYNFSTRRPRTSTSSSAPDPRRSFSNPNRADRSTGTNVTSAFVSRTAALFLGPPSGLVSAMMQIASRLANGALSTASSGGGGAAYRFNLEGLPGRWEDSEEEREHDYEDDEFAASSTILRHDIEDDDYDDLEEDDDNGVDDFGVPLGNDTPARNGRANWGWVRSPASSPRSKQPKHDSGADLVHARKERGRHDSDQAHFNQQQQSRDVSIDNND